MRSDAVSNVDRVAGTICSVWACIRALLPWPRLDDSTDSTGHYGHGIEREGGDNEIPHEQVHRREGETAHDKLRVLNLKPVHV